MWCVNLEELIYGMVVSDTIARKDLAEKTWRTIEPPTRRTCRPFFEGHFGFYPTIVSHFPSDNTQKIQ